MTLYFRPIPSLDPAMRQTGQCLAGGECFFSQVEVLERGRQPYVVPASDLDADLLAPLVASRPHFAGLNMAHPCIMGVMNITPDSFSDGGKLLRPESALMAARAMAADADVLDVGGESTRPGADDVALEEEIARTRPVIVAMRSAGITRPISIDTRKADVAKTALMAGAQIVNDVSGLGFDPDMAELVAKSGAALVLMHSRGTPQTMQELTQYDDVLLDVYDALAERLATAEAAGISRANIMVDPGIGFAKTLEQNLALLARLSLFHSLGVPILLGASRKRFIGEISGTQDAQRRMPGSLAVAMAGVSHGAQMLRVHDVWETRQALALWRATTGGEVV